MANFIYDHTGKKRFLGAILAKPRLKWKIYGADDNQPLIPENEWKSRIDDMPGGNAPDHPNLGWQHDQDGVGQCCPTAGVSIAESCALQQGLPLVKLCAGDVYDRVNGGADNGSLLEDVMAEMQTRGAGTLQTAGTEIWRRGWKAAPADERLKYRYAEVYLAPTFAHCMSGVLSGHHLNSGIMWPNGNPDGEGWLPSNARGAGGHSIHGYKGGYRSGGTKPEWGIRHKQSWGPGWGLVWNGFSTFSIPQSYYGGQIGGWYLVREVIWYADDLPTPIFRANKKRSRKR